MKNDRASAQLIDEQEIRPQMTLPQSAPIRTALPETVLAKCCGELVTGDEDVEEVLQCLGVEFGMTAGTSIVALEARQND